MCSPQTTIDRRENTTQVLEQENAIEEGEKAEPPLPGFEPDASPSVVSTFDLDNGGPPLERDEVSMKRPKRVGRVFHVSKTIILVPSPLIHHLYCRHAKAFFHLSGEGVVPSKQRRAHSHELSARISILISSPKYLLQRRFYVIRFISPTLLQESSSRQDQYVNEGSAGIDILLSPL